MATHTETTPILGRMLRGSRVFVATAMVAAGVMYSPSVLHLAGPVAAGPVPQLVGASAPTVGSPSAQGAASPVPRPNGTTVAPVAGARVNASGTVLTWFNDFGGAPQVTHTAGTGWYYITFPNAPFYGNPTDGNSVLSVTPDTPSGDCTTVNADYGSILLGSGGSPKVIEVWTRDCTQGFADRWVLSSSSAVRQPPHQPLPARSPPLPVPGSTLWAPCSPGSTTSVAHPRSPIRPAVECLLPQVPQRPGARPEHRWQQHLVGHARHVFGRLHGGQRRLRQ